MTPNRVMAVKRIARRSYTSFSQTIVKLHSVRIVKSLGDIIKREFKNICSDQCESMLKGESESIKSFSWEKLWSELQQSMPTLVSLLTTITSSNCQPLVCTIISMLLKNKHQRMGYLQKVISAFLYANGAHKQVTTGILFEHLKIFTLLQIYKCLQPLMLCQSLKAHSI